MRLRVLVVSLIGLFCLVSCSRLGLTRPSMTFDALYPSPSQSEVTVNYSLPAPPQGKVYVLWVVNPEQRKAVNVGAVQAGPDQTAHAKVDFPATGAVISVEDQDHPASMGGDWVLKAGQVTPETPTPDPLRITPTTTETPAATPSATP